MLVFTGCSDDDDNNEFSGGGTELVGTKWFYTEGGILSDYYWQEALVFNTASTFTYSYMELTNLEATDDGEFTGRYKYVAPNLTGKISDGKKTVTITGTLSGNELRISVNGGDIQVFKKEE